MYLCVCCYPYGDGIFLFRLGCQNKLTHVFIFVFAVRICFQAVVQETKMVKKKCQEMQMHQS